MRALLSLVVMLVIAACSASPEGESRMPRQSTEQVSTDPALVSAALRFGGIVLPQAGTVLGVQHDRGVDERYRMVVRLPGDAVAELLNGSGFAGQLVADAGPFPESVDGFHLGVAADPETLSDSLPPGAGRTSTVFREIVVDRSAPDAPVAHLWLFTT